MKIVLQKDVTVQLLQVLNNDKLEWENTLGKWFGFKVTLPRYFWEVKIFLSCNRTPSGITVECFTDAQWLTVFYSYNLQKELGNFMCAAIYKKCKEIENKPDLVFN